MGRKARDPYWITAKRNGECSGCEAPVKKGERAFWYPNGRKILCGRCGEAASREFDAAVWDEENNTCL